MIKPEPTDSAKAATRVYRFLSGTLGVMLSAALAPGATDVSPKPPRPNIIVLLCDDLGYGDLACFANPRIQTPNLDQLAREGMRLTDCYSASPVCSPSRAGLMTGRNPNRMGIRDWIPPASGIFLPRREITVGQLLQAGGYRTFHAGKWHLNSRIDGSESTPADAGFDHSLYTQNNASPSHLNPMNYIRNGRPVGALAGPSSHIVVAEAMRWLDEIKPTPEAPFFLNLWFHEPHEPVAAADEFLALYQDEMNPDRRHYYGDVTQMDAAIGKLLHYLDAHGLRDNTFIFFTSDNGPETLLRFPGSARSYGTPGPLRGMKLHVTEAGYRVPGIVRWPGHVAAGTTSAEPVSSVDFLPTACALAGIAPPGDRALDGGNMLPLFRGEPIRRPHPLFWQYDFAQSRPWTVSLREGRWKLLANATLDEFVLHDLKKDIAEATDQASQHPEIVKAMAAAMRQIHADILAEGKKSENPLPRQDAAKRE